MSIRNVDDATLLLCCELFIEGRAGETSIDAVAEELSRKTKQNFKRVDIYRMVSLAIKRGFFKVLPNPWKELEEQVAAAFGLSGSDREAIHVVPALQPSASEAVSSFAADHALEVIKQVGLAKRGGRVGVGFVGGNTVMRVARLLATRMRHDADLPPKLSFNSVCGGFDPRNPQTAPLSFLGYFTDLPAEVQYGAFVAAPLVSREDSAKLNEDPLYKESLFLRDEIDVVIMSVANFDDQHSVLRDLARITRDQSVLEARGIVGDVCYQFFSKDGPADIDPDRRVLTLFNIEDLVNMAKTKGKEVLLVSGPCRGCGKSREKSLEPLLRVPELKVWSHVYLDSRTAKKLLSRAR